MQDIIISADHLSKKYGNTLAVDDVSLQIRRGAIVGLVGKNGAGKTTLIRMFTGLVKPTSGSFLVVPQLQRNSTTVAAIVEKPSIYNDMTAMDNLVAQSTLLGLQIDLPYLRQTLQLVGLNANAPKLAKDFSLGMKQRLGLAMTLVGKPQLLILDEPTNGLDPQGIYDMREIFVKLNKTYGTTIVISSHILAELSKFATEFYFMHDGKVLKHATVDELQTLGKKQLRLTVDDVQKATTALQQYGKVTLSGENTLLLQSETPLTQIVLALANANVLVQNASQTNDTLEDYFIQLLGSQNDLPNPFDNDGGAL